MAPLMAGVCAAALCGFAVAPAFAADDAAIATASASGTTALAAQDAASDAKPATPSAVQEVVVTGIRRSLRDSANAKKSATGFTDSVFAEDIGKFPDTNLAESLQRIPGVTISRDVDGEGVNIAVRGLGTNFTKILLNGAQIAVASDGTTDAGESNREVDLDMFPTELFTKLTVYKSAYASILEGGSSGTVDMVNARPFDNPGQHLTFTYQEGYSDSSQRGSPRGAIIASKTWGDKLGILVGVAGAANNYKTTGYETIGYTTPALAGNAAYPDCVVGGKQTCDTVGGAGLHFASSETEAQLLAANPGMTLQQISNTLIPRLGRSSWSQGHRDRLSFLTSVEFRPTSDLKFTLDALYGVADRKFNRLDMDWAVRDFGSGPMIPSNMKADANGVLTSGAFADSQFFLEARPYHETLSFLNLNPSMSWRVNDWLKIDGQVNANRSVFFREAPSYLFQTPQDVTVDYNNTGDVPSITTVGSNLNDPNLGWSWNRVNVQNVKRITEDKGTHWNAQFGDNVNNIKVGVAYDDVARTIRAFDNSTAYGNCTYGSPLGTPAIGNVSTVGNAQYLYPCSSLTLSNAALAANPTAYIGAGPGFIQANYAALDAATHYGFYSQYAPFAGSSATATPSGSIEEKTGGAYLELNGKTEWLGHEIRFNAGGRYFSTDQTIAGPITLKNQAGVTVNVYQFTPNGGKQSLGSYVSTAGPCTIPGLGPQASCLYNQLQTSALKTKYDGFLPSFNVAANLTDKLILRLAGSRTVTRADPNKMLPGTSIADTTGLLWNQGNPKLAPYYSNNFDAGLEFYTGGSGYIAVDVFNKSVQGFTQNGQTTEPFSALGIPINTLPTSPVDLTKIITASTPVTVNTTVNASGNLVFNGVELTYNQPLDFVLKGLGFTSNYTHVDQTSTGSLPLATGVARYTYNLGGYYENHGLSVHVTYNYQDRRIIATAPQNNINVPLGADPYGQVDLSANYTLPWFGGRAQITFDALNLNDERQRTYFGYEAATYTYYKPGSTYMLGFRGRF